MEQSPEKLGVPPLVKKFPTFSVTQKAIAVILTFPTKCTYSKQTYIVLSPGIHFPRCFSLNKPLKSLALVPILSHISPIMPLHTVSLTSILTLSSHLCLRSSNSLLPSGFCTKPSYVPHTLPISSSFI